MYFDGVIHLNLNLLSAYSKKVENKQHVLQSPKKVDRQSREWYTKTY